MSILLRLTPISIVYSFTVLMLPLACTRPLPPHMSGPGAPASGIANSAAPSTRNSQGASERSTVSAGRAGASGQPGLPSNAAPRDPLTPVGDPLAVRGYDPIAEDSPDARDSSEAAALPQETTNAQQVPQATSSGSGSSAQPRSNAIALPGSAGSAPLPGWRIVIPQLGVDTSIVSVGLEPDGAMGAPETPDVVGWYRHGTAPGQQGNVLLDGHVDWTDRITGIPRTGVFWSLAKLPVGSEIIIADGTREYVYQVTEKMRFSWDDPQGASVLQPTADARATLITCGGAFDRATRSYALREVVIARLVS